MSVPAWLSGFGRRSFPPESSRCGAGRRPSRFRIPATRSSGAPLRPPQRVGASLRPFLLAPLLALSLLGPAPDAAAQTEETLISNIGQADGGVTRLRFDYAQAFSTGSTAYSLRSVEIEWALTVTGLKNDITVGIYTNSSGSPGTSLGTLTDPNFSTSLTDTVYKFTTSGIELEANTTYFVVLDSAVFNYLPTIRLTASNAEDTGGKSGWSIANGSLNRSWSSTGNWTSYTSSMKIRLKGVISTSTVTIAPKTNAPITEGEDAVFTLSVSPAPAAAMPVKVSVADSSVPGAAVSRTVTIPASATSQDYAVATDDDAHDGLDGTVTVTLTADDAYTLGTPASASITVLDNDPTSVTLTGDTAALTEGHSKRFSLEIGGELYRGESLSIPLTFGGTATRGTDYTLSCAAGIGVTCANLNGGGAATVRFAGPADGYSDVFAAITLTARSDGVADAGETVNIGVGAATATGLSGGAATPVDRFGQFTLNDPPPPALVFSPASLTVDEGGSASYTVRLGSAPPADVTVTVGGTAGAVTVDTDGRTNGNQDTLTFTPSNWDRARTVSVRGVDDSDIADDSATLTHSASGGGYAGVTGSVAVTVKDDDVPPTQPVVSIDGGSAVSEGGTAVFTLTANPVPTGSITVSVNVTDSGSFAKAGQTGSKEVSIGSGGTATLSVTTDNDAIDEPDGRITATLASGSGYTVAGANNADSVTVNDNDTPSVIGIDVGRSIIREDDTAATFTLTANPAPSGDLPVTVDVSDSGSFADTGQTGSREVIIGTGGTATLSVTIDDDDRDEPDGRITATLVAGPGYTVDPANNADSVTVLDEDSPAPIPEVSISGGDAVTEGGTVTFTLTANPFPRTQDGITVNVDVADSGRFAASGQTGRRTVFMRYGLSTTTLTVATDNDSADELNGSITATLAAGTGYTLDSENNADSVTVNDNDRPGVSVSAGSDITEGETATFTLTVSLAPTDSMKVSVLVYEGGTGSFLSTGQGGGREVTIDSSGTATFSVATDDDTTDEDHNVINVNIVPDSGYRAVRGKSNAELWVRDNDGPNVSISAGGDITEGGTASFTLTASPRPAGADTVEVDVNVVDSGSFANAGQTGSKTVTIGNSGTATLTVTTDDDSTDEPNGSITATLTSADSGYTPHPNAASASVTVNDNDGPPATPVVSITGGSAVTEGGSASFTLTASPAPTSTITVNVNVADSGSFAASGQTNRRTVSVTTSGTASFTVTTLDDSTDEPNGAITATVQTGSGYTPHGTNGSASVTVNDNDDPPTTPVVSISGGSAVTEGGSASFTLNASPAPTGTITVSVSVADSGSFAASGQTGRRNVSVSTSGTASFTVTTLDDSTDESNGAITATVQTGSGYSPHGTNGSASVTVNDNDPTPPTTPVVSISGGSAVTEGGSATFTLTATPAPQASITVNVTVAQTGSFAASGQTGGRTVSIGTGGTGTLSVATDDDSTDEPNGRITATLGTGSGYTVDSANASDSVAVNDNDDPLPEISITSLQPAGRAAFEGEALRFRVSADRAPAADLDIDIVVAQPGNAFVNSGDTGAKTVTIARNTRTATYSVPTHNDTVEESPSTATVTVTVSAGTGYTVHGTRNAATAVVADDEGIPGLSIADGEGSEGSYIEFRVTLTKPAPVRVELGWYATVHGSAQLANGANVREDLEETTGTLRIPAGASGGTIEVWAVDDAHDDPGEQFYILSSHARGAVVTDGEALGTVLNDDPIPGAWLGRFGRAVAEQALDGIAARMTADRTPGFRGNFAGQPLGGAWAESCDGGGSARGGAGDRASRQSALSGAPAHVPDNRTGEPAGLHGPAEAHTVRHGTQDRTGGSAHRHGPAGPRGGPNGSLSADGCGQPMGANGAGPNGPSPAGGRGGQAASAFPSGGQPMRLDGAGPDGFPAPGRDPHGAGGDVGAWSYGGVGTGSSHGPPQGQSQGMTLADLLLGGSFAYNGRPDGAGGTLAFWGRGARSHFQGADESLRLDGGIATAMLGADYARGDWLLGVALTQSVGRGDYDHPEAQSGEVESTLTAAIPWTSWRPSDRLTLWGAAGYGGGRLTVSPLAGRTVAHPVMSPNADMGNFMASAAPTRRRATIATGRAAPAAHGDPASQPATAMRTDIGWRMAALGGRGELSGAPGGGGLALAVVSDALWTSTSSDRAQGLAASEADTTRLRLGLEGSWTLALGEGAVTPKLEAGLRHDGGDADEGFGVELGGGLAWADPRLGLELDIAGRMLLAHESSGFEDMGFSASLTYRPGTDAGLGPSLVLRQDYGGQATGGLDALFMSDPLAQRMGGGMAESRWTAEAAWGFGAFGDRFVGTPTLGYGLAGHSRDYSVGWRLAPLPEAGGPDLSLGLMLTRRESLGAPPEHGVGIEVRARW